MCLRSLFLTSTPCCVRGGVSDGRDTHEMVRGILVAPQNFGPWVAIATHDRSTAVLYGFTQAPAGGDKSDEEEMEREDGQQLVDDGLKSIPQCWTTQHLIKRDLVLVFLFFTPRLHTDC